MTTTRVRGRRRERAFPWPVWLYWVLRRSSPLILLVAVAASGLLGMRVILVWGVGGPEHSHGPDIPIAAAVFFACALLAAALYFPPSPAVARVERPLPIKRAVVAGLGAQWRIYFLIAVPVSGTLSILAPFTIPVALGWDPDIPANLWLGLPVSVLLTAFAVASLWAVARSMLHGVELTRSHLVARGYFATKKYARDEIVDVRIVGVSGWWPTVLFEIARMGVANTLAITLANGSKHVLYAANSTWGDMTRGVDVIRAWVEAESAGG